MLPRITLLLLLFCVVRLHLAQESIHVDDYFSSLSTEELQKICRDRGFEISNAMSREEYIEAAKRCVSLEDDINAVLNEHPELAAEIDAEIHRLEQQREKLEQEREAMLREKEFLEQQLRQAGIDINDLYNETAVVDRGGTTGRTPRNHTAFQERMSKANPTTALEVLKESFILLYLRVREDMILVWKLVSPVALPLWASIRRIVGMLRRYTFPPRQLTSEQTSHSNRME